MDSTRMCTGVLGQSTIELQNSRIDARLKNEREQIEVASVAMRAGEKCEGEKIDDLMLNRPA